MMNWRDRYRVDDLRSWLFFGLLLIAVVSGAILLCVD
jgi:hypothetical protein